MSARELQRIEVLTEVVAGRRDVVSGAAVLTVSVRQMHRLLARYREGGGGALIHKSRGRPASHNFRNTRLAHIWGSKNRRKTYKIGEISFAGAYRAPTRN